MTSIPIDKTLPLWSALTEDESLQGCSKRYLTTIRPRDAEKAGRIATESAFMAILQSLTKVGAGRFEPTTTDALLTTGAALFDSPGLILAHPQAESELRARQRGMRARRKGPRYFANAAHNGGMRTYRLEQKTFIKEPMVQYGGLISIESGDVRYWCSDIEVDPDRLREEGLIVVSVLLAVKVDRPLRRISLAKMRRAG